MAAMSNLILYINELHTHPAAKVVDGMGWLRPHRNHIYMCVTCIRLIGVIHDWWIDFFTAQVLG